MRSYLSVLSGREVSGLLILPVGLLGCLYLVLCVASEPICFENLAEFKEFLPATGLYSHNGMESGEALNNFYLADYPVTLDDLDKVARRLDCGLTPAWRGILWVCEIKNSAGSIRPHSIGGQCRVWGNILVAGDVHLMDRLQQWRREQSRRVAR